MLQSSEAPQIPRLQSSENLLSDIKENPQEEINTKENDIKKPEDPKNFLFSDLSKITEVNQQLLFKKADLDFDVEELSRQMKDLEDNMSRSSMEEEDLVQERKFFYFINFY